MFSNYQLETKAFQSSVFLTLLKTHPWRNPHSHQLLNEQFHRIRDAGLDNVGLISTIITTVDVSLWISDTEQATFLADKYSVIV